MSPKSLAEPGVIENRAIDEARPLRVVCIGAGISGILASIRLPHKLSNIQLQVYEKNAEIGGTWSENRYPGCACDIPAHTYQPTFEPNLEWTQFYASAKEIHRYWERVVDKYDCMRFIKLKHEVTYARWDAEQSEWKLKIRNLETDTTFEESCNVLISATGSLNNWKWPAIPGIDTFQGKLLHSASWDESYDYTGENVAIIGNGSSGIQLVPAMLPRVEHIDHYARGRTWISSTLAKKKVEERGAELDNFSFTEEDLRSFKNDPGAYKKFRKDVELELQSAHGVTFKDSPAQVEVRKLFTQDMKKRLARKPELADQLIPTFPPCARRLTPGPGYLEALCDDKVDVIREDIVEIDANGIITADGKHRPVDTIVCATGFDTTYIPRFPIAGENGVLLSNRWKKVPETYLSLATDGFPNYFISLGPNGGLGTGNLVLVIEKVIDYFAECIAKMQRDNIKTMVVRRDAVKRFTGYCDNFFKRTVYSVKCRSWYKSGTEDGRVNALWPGSSLHAVKAVANPRWEDFQYEYVNNNPGGWIGDSWTQDEKDNSINVDYLDDDAIDFPLPSKEKRINGYGANDLGRLLA